MIQGLLQTPANPANRAEVKISDTDLIAMIKDRSQKVKTQKPFEPTGKFGSYEASLEAFKTKRAANIEFAKTTEADLRNRVQPFPFGSVDAYQILLFMSAHTERHVRQIEEIVVHESFPKKWFSSNKGIKKATQWVAFYFYIEFSLFQLFLNGYLLESFHDIAFEDVVVVFHLQTTIVSFGYFLHIILESF